MHLRKTGLILLAAVVIATVAVHRWSAHSATPTSGGVATPSTATVSSGAASAASATGATSATSAEAQAPADAERTAPRPRESLPAAGTAVGVVRLSLDAPPVVAPGDTVDLLLTGSGRTSVRSVALKLRFDPTRLRLRSVEEIDYAGARSDPARFAVEHIDGGEVIVTASAADGSGLATTRPVGIVQFEAIARGWTKVDAVASLIVDDAGRMLDSALARSSVQLAIN